MKIDRLIHRQDRKKGTLFERLYCVLVLMNTAPFSKACICQLCFLTNPKDS